jgi:hypothetical protein
MAAVLAVSLPANLVLLSRSRPLETAEAGAGVALERRLSPSASGLPGCRQAAERLRARIDGLARELAIAEPRGARGPDGRALLDGALAAFKSSGAVAKCQPNPSSSRWPSAWTCPRRPTRRAARAPSRSTWAAPPPPRPSALAWARPCASPWPVSSLPAHASTATVFATIPDPAPAPPPPRPRQKTPGRAYD